MPIKPDNIITNLGNDIICDLDVCFYGNPIERYVILLELIAVMEKQKLILTFRDAYIADVQQQ